MNIRILQKIKDKNKIKNHSNLCLAILQKRTSKLAQCTMLYVIYKLLMVYNGAQCKSKQKKKIMSYEYIPHYLFLHIVSTEIIN